MAEDALIKVEGVSKKFCRDLKLSLRHGMQDIVGELLGRPRTLALRTKEFWAVQGVDFELKRGQCLGLIGHNGAGKTTLLRMLNGLIKPDAGRIEMRGRVGALIALGAGFNPILTGRENIYVNGAVLGLSRREVDSKINEIIDFAEIADSIDAPVQTYSSGMNVRLGFAIATSMDPDILILDEVLAVGDASFRHKCYHRINRMMKNCAVIFVSHGMSQVAQVATAVGMMRKGRFEYYGNVVDGISAYNAENTDKEETSEEERVFSTYAPVRRAEMIVVEREVDYGAELKLELWIDLDRSLEGVVLSFTAVNEQEQPVMNWNSTRSNAPLDLPAGRSVVRFSIAPLYLHDGSYKWNLWMSKGGSIEALVFIMRGGEFRVRSEFKPVSDIPYLPAPVGVVVTPVNEWPMQLAGADVSQRVL